MTCVLTMWKIQLNKEAAEGSKTWVRVVVMLWVQYDPLAGLLICQKLGGDMAPAPPLG